MEKPNTIYNRIAGENAERLASLSDNIFGVSMTLMLLDLTVPVQASIHSEAGLVHALLGLSPTLLVYLMSFITLGIFWVGQQTQLNYMAKSDRHLTWLNLTFLFLVTLLPFSTRLLDQFIAYRIALLVYWFNIFLLGLVIYFCWEYARKAKLTKEGLSPEFHKAVRRRIVGAQGLYAVGLALASIDTHISIGFIILIQLNFALAPRLGWLSRI